MRLKLAVPAETPNVVWIPFYNVVIEGGKRFSVDAYFLEDVAFINRGLLVKKYEVALQSDVEVGERDVVLNPRIGDASEAVELLYQGYREIQRVYDELYPMVREKMRPSIMKFLKILFLGGLGERTETPELEAFSNIYGALILYREILGEHPEKTRQVYDYQLFWRPFIISMGGGGVAFLDASISPPVEDRFYTNLYSIDEGMREAVAGLGGRAAGIQKTGER